MSSGCSSMSSTLVDLSTILLGSGGNNPKRWRSRHVHRNDVPVLPPLSHSMWCCRIDCEATRNTGAKVGSCHLSPDLHHRTCNNLHPPVNLISAEGVILSAQSVLLISSYLGSRCWDDNWMATQDYYPESPRSAQECPLRE